MMVQFFRGIPLELDESAMLDGCNKFTVYSRIIMPLIKPALMTSAIFSFYWRWEDFLAPLLYLSRPRLFTVPLAIRMFADPTGETNWGAIFAMGTLSLLPSLLIFFIFQKHKRQGNPQSCFTDPPAALYRLWRFNYHLVALFERTNKLISLLKSNMILKRPFRTFFLIRKNKSCIFAIKCLLE
jgi:ABC-type Fe3+ transport system permease subunit